MKNLLIMLAVLLSGCAVTEYQSTGVFGGFTDTQLGVDIFKVSYQGNAQTKSDQVEEMALLRSSEVALKNGFSYFIIVSGVSKSNYNFDFDDRARPSTSNTIKCFKEKPKNDGLIYDAKFLFDSLGKKYNVSRKS